MEIILNKHNYMIYSYQIRRCNFIVSSKKFDNIYYKFIRILINNLNGFCLILYYIIRDFNTYYMIFEWFLLSNLYIFILNV